MITKDSVLYTRAQKALKRSPSDSQSYTPLDTRKFVERTSSRGRVDVQAATIYGVKLLGRKSKNAREYTEEALRNGVELYRNVKVYMGHPKREDMSEDRAFADWVGIVQNPRYERDAIYGDIKLRRESSHFSALIEAAETFAGSFGCSHVAAGYSVERHGIEYIEQIGDVHSVDLVMEPATTNGLFESVGDGDGLTDKLAATLREVLEVHSGNEKLAELAQLILAELSFVSAAEKLSPDEESGEESGTDFNLGSEPARESFAHREIPTEQLQRFAALLR